MRSTVAPAEGVSEPPAPRSELRPRSQYIAAVAATAVSFAALGLLILARYPLRHYSYPIGWDSAFYVWRSAAVTVDGLARIGTVRPGSPLLVGILMRMTGQNAFTMVAVAMAVLAAIVALGTAAMSRAALGVNAGWMVLVGALSWVAFGHIGMIPGGHLDNVLNAAFVVSAFAAAVSFVGQRKGAVATAVLFAASALAEWPFYVLAGAIFVLGLVLFAWPALRASGEHRSEVMLRVIRPLLLALGASAVFAGLAVLTRPQGRLLHHFSEQGRTIIKERFMQRLRDPARWYALPLAVLGGLLAARIPLSPRRDPARRLFLSLLVAWIVVTLGMSLAQLFDLPVAGGRLLNYLFAVPLLAGVFCWVLNRALSMRYGGTGMLLGALIALAAAVGFGTLAWQGEGGGPSIPPASVRQAATAGQYAGTTGPDTEVIFLQGTGRHAWEVLQASLPPDLVPRVTRFSGSPGELEERVADGGEGEAVVFVLKAYSPSWYRDALGIGSWSTVAPGVLVRGESPPSLPVGGAPPKGTFGALALVWIVGAVALLLAAAGSGWAVALLPADPLIRVTLAPALGAATITMAAVMWDRLGLGFSTIGVWVLALLTTGAGWALAAWAGRRRAPAASTHDGGGEGTAL
jgi:hypothetical protein